MGLEELEQELQTFKERLPELLEGIEGYVGNIAVYALIKGTEIRGTFHSERDAIDIGYREYGNVPFLVGEINEFPRPLSFVTPDLVQISPR